MSELVGIIATIMGALLLGSVFLVVYHHALYPLVLRFATERRRKHLDEVPVRRWCAARSDPELPRIAILTPAYNEAGVIADKIRNAAALDYPPSRLHLVIVCDGCTDDTAAVARSASREPECSHLRVDIVEFAENGGKVARINGCIPLLDADIVALSDASALISVDALLIAADHFSDPAIGAVCATYRLIAPESAGEAMYWEYQTRIKECEASLGASIGAHGAFYLFRHSLFRALPPDTINDDFILPMTIVAAGFRSVYDPRMVALEIEKPRPHQDYRRRKRIAAGNLQQTIRLKALLKPRYRGTAFVFASGKALRSFVPFLLLYIFVASLLLFKASPIYAALFLAQVVVYGLAALPYVFPRHRFPKAVATVQYFVKGHLAGLVGASRYMLGLERATWRSADARSTPELRAMRRFNEYLARLTATTSSGSGRHKPTSQPMITHAHPVVRYGKRAFDLVFCLLILAVAAPLLPVIALCIAVDSRGPVFFLQQRIGECRSDYTRLFHVIKFRSMRVDAEADTGAVWASEDDPRVTRVGRFLRRTRLDELPQLINVLRGEMSLIGPRPERPGFFASLDSCIPYYGERSYGVKPGITGFAQVVNRADENINDVRVKLYYDHAYALALSQPIAWLTLDYWIIFRTIILMALGPKLLAGSRPACIRIV